MSGAAPELRRREEVVGRCFLAWGREYNKLIQQHYCTVALLVVSCIVGICTGGVL